MSIGEFQLISRYFAPLSVPDAPAYGLTDDAAVLTPPPGKDLIFTKDILVADVHFRAEDPPELIARKALRVNLSDLAAMGAEPLGYLLALALPKNMDDLEGWIKAFAYGLMQDQEGFGLSLFGGDTVATTGPLTISITAIGTVTSGRALRRKGAKPGDDIYVSGTLGDSAAGLKCLEGGQDNLFLISRYHRPIPRLALGQKLHGLAAAVMDISDGLAGDMGHICTLSGLGAEITAGLIPHSDEFGKVLESFPHYTDLIWNGGDDYELLFTAPKAAAKDIKALSEYLQLPLTNIGRMTAETDIKILDSGGKNLLQGGQAGYRHF